MTPSDLTRLEAIRERHKKYDNEAICQYCAETWPCTVAWLLARLAPATPSGAATAGDAREEKKRDA